MSGLVAQVLMLAALASAAPPVRESALADGCRLRVTLSASEPDGPVDEARWHLLCPRNRALDLGSDLSALVAVDTLLPSPDGRFLAVLSHGEGHPWLEIVDLPRLRTGHGYRVLAEINPYPGTLALDGWATDALRLTSDASLDRIARGERPGGDAMASGLRRFRLAVAGWRVEADEP